MPDHRPPSDDDVTLPVSARIRTRILRAGRRFNANDNIAAFLRPGELDLLLEEVAGKMQGVLESLVIDTESDHNTQDTAKRVAKMYLQEVFRGRYMEAPPVTEFPNAEFLNELMIVGPITIRSACSHHFCPIMGRLWIGLMPNEHSNLIGLSKYLAAGGMDHEPAADSGGSDHADRRTADEQGDARRAGGRDGGGSFLHALARGEGTRLPRW